MGDVQRREKASGPDVTEVVWSLYRFLDSRPRVPAAPKLPRGWRVAPKRTRGAPLRREDPDQLGPEWDFLSVTSAPGPSHPL